MSPMSRVFEVMQPIQDTPETPQETLDIPRFDVIGVRVNTKRKEDVVADPLPEADSAARYFRRSEVLKSSHSHRTTPSAGATDPVLWDSKHQNIDDPTRTNSVRRSSKLGCVEYVIQPEVRRPYDNYQLHHHSTYPGIQRYHPQHPARPIIVQRQSPGTVEERPERASAGALNRSRNRSSDGPSHTSCKVTPQFIEQWLRTRHQRH